MKRSNSCPLCQNIQNNTRVFLKKNINHEKIGKFSFSSRKVPEFMNYELLECKNCSFIYAINIPNLDQVKNDYQNSIFVSSDDADDAAQTYFNKIIEKIPIDNSGHVLEIGAGSGSFLIKLKKLGFKKIVGIEPSVNSIAIAKDEIKKKLINDVFEKVNIQNNSYDLVCCFMTLEHVHDPILTIKKSFDILCSKGKIILVVHNAHHVLHKILGKKSPIIDVEHLQLFSSKSIKHILKMNNFSNIEIYNLKNSYRLKYWVSLLPLPKRIKNLIQKIFKIFKISNYKLRLNVGNIMIKAEKNVK